MDRSEIKILVVNDKVDLRNFIRNCLRTEEFTQISISENGRSAWRKAKDDPPHLVIADDELPEMSGLELLQEMRKDRELSQTPFILISSETQQMHVARAAERRVDAYLLKPFSQWTLADKVNRLLERVLHPSVSHLEYLEANRLAQDGDLDTALEIYQAALVGTKRSMAALHYKIGQIHERMAQGEEAEADYGRAADMSSLFVDAWDALGRIDLEKSRFDQAADRLKKSVSISPLSARRQLRYGEAQFQSGRFEEAEQAFRRSLELDPQQPNLYNRLGIALRRQGKNDEAETWLLRAVEVTENDEHLFYNLSRVYQDRGDPNQARQYLEKALAVNPGFREALDLRNEIERAGTK